MTSVGPSSKTFALYIMCTLTAGKFYYTKRKYFLNENMFTIATMATSLDIRLVSNSHHLPGSSFAKIAVELDGRLPMPVAPFFVKSLLECDY